MHSPEILHFSHKRLDIAATLNDSRWTRFRLRRNAYHMKDCFQINLCASLCSSFRTLPALLRFECTALYSGVAVCRVRNVGGLLTIIARVLC